MQDSRDIELKAIGIFSAATVVIGLVGFSAGRVHNDPASLAFLVLALAAYICSAGLAFVCLRTRPFLRSIQADWLWPNRWQDSVEDIKHSLVQNIASAYANNKAIRPSTTGRPIAYFGCPWRLG